jgi:hypothetical protein
MNDLQDRLDRLALALTDDSAPPPPELIRRRGRRRRVARAGAVALLLAAMAFLPASRLGWLDRTAPSGPAAPLGRPTTSLPRGQDSKVPAPPRPVGPVVTVAEGTLDGLRWKYIAYRAKGGQICSGFQPVGFSTPHGYISCRNSTKPYTGSHSGGLGISDFGADFSGGSDGVPDAMDEEVSRDVVRVRFLLEGGRGIDLQTHGTEAGLPNNFYAERLPDMRDVRAIVAYDRHGNQVWRQDRGPKRDAWWPNF